MVTTNYLLYRYARRVAPIIAIILVSEQLRLHLQILRDFYQDVPDQDALFQHDIDIIEGGVNQSRITTENNSNKSHANSRSPLGCTEIAGLEIVRRLGIGTLKTAFEVKLPWGEHAVAKRCHSYLCYKGKRRKNSINLIERESKILQELHKQYGNEGALQFFGECYIPFDNFGAQDVISNDNKTALEHLLKESLTDFSIGYTSLVELGKPFLYKNERNYRMKKGCFGDFFTHRDVKDLINIARRYANFPDSPILLTGFLASSLNNKNITTGLLGKTSDNQNPNQYITRIGSGQRADEGSIYHADVDTVFHCKDRYKKKTWSKYCTIDRVLKTNCEVIANLTNIAFLDCSLPSTGDTINNIVTSKAPFLSVDTPGDSGRINSTYALEECLAKEAKAKKKKVKKKNVRIRRLR